MLAVFLLLATASPTWAASVPAEGWTLATADTRLTVTVADNRPVVTRLESTSQPGNWAAAGLAVPLMAKVWVDRDEISTRWQYLGASRNRAAGTLTLAFSNAEPRMILRSIWRARPGRGPVEHWIEITNLTAAPICVSHQDSLSLLGLRPNAPATIWWIKRGASNASVQGGTFTQALTASTDLLLPSNCEDGASPVPWLAVQIGKRRGLYVGWEFSGLGRVKAKGTGGGGLDLSVGLNEDFRTDVEPGERFLVPPAFVGCYAGDVDDGSYSLHRFVIEKLRPSVPAGFPDPPIICGLYFDAGGPKAKEADVLAVAERFRRMGIELFACDAMWFAQTGDWRWDPARFPRGVGPIERYVHSAGMKFGLWCAWTNGGVSEHPGALSIRGSQAHPDWFRSDVAPNWEPGPFYGAQLCLACPAAKAWAIHETQRLVRDYGLDYLKHDCGPIVNSCTRTDHRHHYGVDVSYWSTMGYYEVQEKLRKACPGVVLENCSGAGHIKDFGVVSRTHYTVVTDTLSALPDRQGIYDSTFALPPLALLAYTTDYVFAAHGDEPEPYLWRSAMMSGWEIGPARSETWTDEQCAKVLQATEVYKSWIRPMFRDVEVHHILPRPDGVHWDGMFYWSPSLRHGMVFLFRPAAKKPTKTFALKGLSARKRYWIWCEDGSIQPGLKTGAELMTKGLTAHLSRQYTSDLIYVRDAAIGKPEGLARPGVFRLKPASTRAGHFFAEARLSWTPSAYARNYRVVVWRKSDLSQPIVERTTPTTMLTLTHLAPGQRLYYAVTAISWGGQRANAGGPGEFATPPLKALAGVTFVSDMPWVRSNAGAGNPVRRDHDLYGQTIAIGGKQYPKGVWTHAYNDATPADVVVDIAGKGFGTFAADVGVDDAAHGGSVQFQVIVDGALKAQSPVMRPGAAYPLRVDVSGAREVILRVLNGGDGYICDHAAWGFARFIAEGARDPL